MLDSGYIEKNNDWNSTKLLLYKDFSKKYGKNILIKRVKTDTKGLWMFIVESKK